MNRESGAFSLQDGSNLEGEVGNREDASKENIERQKRLALTAEFLKQVGRYKKNSEVRSHLLVVGVVLYRVARFRKFESPFHERLSDPLYSSDRIHSQTMSPSTALVRVFKYTQFGRRTI